MKLIAIILLYIANWLMPCDHMFFTTKWYVPKRSKGYWGYSLQEKCANCGKIQYPLSKNKEK